MKVTNFGHYKNYNVTEIHLTNKNNITAVIITYGATLKNLYVPDKNGHLVDTVIGYDDLSGYVEDTMSMGATIGRVANRISNAQFQLNNRKYLLAANNGKHHLHGEGCLARRNWEYETFVEDGEEGVRLKTRSYDGECGYPGDVEFTVVYLLSNSNQLILKFEAFNKSPLQTVLNLTNHSYFNLDGNQSILDQILKIEASSYLPVDDSALVTGEIKKLSGNLKKIQHGVILRELVNDRGVLDTDNDFIKDNDNSVLTLYSPVSGITLTISTTYPVFHIYGSEHIYNIKGKTGRIYAPCSAIAIEPQKYTNAINVVSYKYV
uniref:Galactose mutarotase n=1 Tax=Syphacia muris TaxID=451379 RepID=A0A0N5AYV6_9BILA